MRDESRRLGGEAAVAASDAWKYGSRASTLRVCIVNVCMVGCHLRTRIAIRVAACVLHKVIYVVYIHNRRRMCGRMLCVCVYVWLCAVFVSEYVFCVGVRMQSACATVDNIWTDYTTTTTNCDGHKRKPSVAVFACSCACFIVFTLVAYAWDFLSIAVSLAGCVFCVRLCRTESHTTAHRWTVVENRAHARTDARSWRCWRGRRDDVVGGYCGGRVVLTMVEWILRAEHGRRAEWSVW